MAISVSEVRGGKRYTHEGGLVSMYVALALDGSATTWNTGLSRVLYATAAATMYDDDASAYAANTLTVETITQSETGGAWDTINLSDVGTVNDVIFVHVVGW